MSGRSLEADMLHAIGYFHPVDHLTLMRVLGEWRGEEIGFPRFKVARSNLTQLGLIEHPKMDIKYYLTEEGWEELGAETPLSGDDSLRQSTELY